MTNSGALSGLLRHYFHVVIPSSVVDLGNFAKYCYNDLPHVKNALSILVFFVLMCLFVMQILIPTLSRAIIYPPSSRDLVKEGKDLLQRFGEGVHSNQTAWNNLHNRFIEFRALNKFRQALRKDRTCLEAYSALATELARLKKYQESSFVVENGLKLCRKLKSGFVEGSQHNLNYTFYEINKFSVSLETLQLENQAMEKERQRHEFNKTNDSIHCSKLSHQINIGQFEGLDGFRPVKTQVRKRKTLKTEKNKNSNLEC